MSEKDREDMALQGIRATLGSFGHDLSELTDEDLRAAVLEVHRISVKCGLNADEVIRLMESLAASGGGLPYECVGGPLDGQVVVIQSNELRVEFGPPRVAEDRLDQLPPARIGIYRIFQPEKKHLTHLAWMGEL